MYYKIEKNNVNAVTCNYSFIEDGYIRIEIRTYFNLTDDSLESVQIIISDASLTEETIIFALTHFNDFTLSTNIQDTTALQEVLRKTDESYMMYAIADKWKTVKSINNIGTEYKIKKKKIINLKKMIASNIHGMLSFFLYCNIKYEIRKI